MFRQAYLREAPTVSPGGRVAGARGRRHPSGVELASSPSAGRRRHATHALSSVPVPRFPRTAWRSARSRVAEDRQRTTRQRLSARGAVTPTRATSFGNRRCIHTVLTMTSSPSRKRDRQRYHAPEDVEGEIAKVEERHESTGDEKRSTPEVERRGHESGRHEGSACRHRPMYGQTCEYATNSMITPAR